MLIKQVILGLLSEMPLTGYDLKKRFSGSALLPWSGNNNQIYKALLELHDEELVTIEVQQQEGKPQRKLYTLTDKGHEALRQWLESTPEIAQFDSPLLIQLLWADRLDKSALRPALEAYEEELRVHIAMQREHIRRQAGVSSVQQDGDSLAARAAAHWIALYELHLDWVHQLLEGLS